MQSSKVSPLYSDGYFEICRFFATNHPPYTLDHIREFNGIYRQAYPHLVGVERCKAEEFVDYMIDHVGQPSWANKIYGVV